MKVRYLIIGAVLLPVASYGQKQLQPTIAAMKWGVDYKLHVRLANDSAYVVDVRGLYHTGRDLFVDTTDNSATYYPVTLDREFVDYIKSKKIDTSDSLSLADSNRTASYKTLWSALHSNLGGGYIHFVNCLIYALESQNLKLNDPIFKRPATRWKPNPVTQSYKRTHKWSYFYPDNQKLAQKEYRIRLKENDLKDLQGVPLQFTNLFLHTSQKKYEELVRQQKNREVAQINLIRLLLGAKYLGEDQIRHISNSVISAVLKYNVNTLPSIIIFDDYNAAVALTLDMNGYRIDRIVYSDGEVISGKELEGRTAIIDGLIRNINEANERVFQKKLQLYYQKTR